MRVCFESFMSEVRNIAVLSGYDVIEPTNKDLAKGVVRTTPFVPVEVTIKGSIEL
jgi:hypothetical protein